VSRFLLVLHKNGGANRPLHLTRRNCGFPGFTVSPVTSLAAARSDGGTHRADWSAAAFARLKSMIVTGMKN
jgi:hypothetical protein